MQVILAKHDKYDINDIFNDVSCHRKAYNQRQVFCLAFFCLCCQMVSDERNQSQVISSDNGGYLPEDVINAAGDEVSVVWPEG